ncbi:hypothetical protein Bca101_072059 [Brassica carinata]
MSLKSAHSCVRFVDEDKPLALWESNDEKLELDDMRSIQDKRDKWLLFPKRTIREILESTQNSVRLTESQEHTDGMFTPSTKRKEAWNDPPADLTSHTKKLCSKAIKVEKMNDLEAEANKNT